MNEFIAVDGLDGTGKTTLCMSLSKSLGYQYLCSIPVEYAEYAERIALNQFGMDARFLYYLSGVVAQQTQVRKISSDGCGVVMDRSVYSTVAYHRAMGVKISLESLSGLNLLRPDCLIILEANQDTRHRRLSSRSTLKWHEKDIDFQRAVELEFGKISDCLRIRTDEMKPDEVLGTVMDHLTNCRT